MRTKGKKDPLNFLTPAQKLDLLFSPCNYTGRSPAFGIDRINSTGDYTPNNTVACSTAFNIMKNALSVEELERDVCEIAHGTAYWVMPDTSHMPPTFYDKTQQPVAVRMDNGTKVIFPSIGYAAYMASILGGDAGWTEVLIHRDPSEGGGRWSNATAKEYNSQHLIFQGQEHHEFAVWLYTLYTAPGRMGLPLGSPVLQAVVLRLADGSEVIFESIRSAARITGVSSYYINRDLSEGAPDCMWRYAAADEVPTQGPTTDIRQRMLPVERVKAAPTMWSKGVVPKQPVAVSMDNGMEFLFPSLNCAATMASFLGGSRKGSTNIILRDLSEGGGRWRYKTVDEYHFRDLSTCIGQEYQEFVIWLYTRYTAPGRKGTSPLVKDAPPPPPAPRTPLVPALPRPSLTSVGEP
jgi:hypothetical protein